MCIRSKISEYHLDQWMWLNSVQMCTPTGSRWTPNNYITSCHRRLESVQFQAQLESVGDKMPNWEPAADRGLGPSVTHGWAAQPECERSAAVVRRTLGQYVAVCPRLQLTFHTQETSTLSRINCERYIFIKKCVRSFMSIQPNHSHCMFIFISFVLLFLKNIFWHIVLLNVFKQNNLIDSCEPKRHDPSCW